MKKSLLATALGSGGGSGGELAKSVDFDGANDYLSRSSDLTGNSDGKTFTFSFWVYIDKDSGGSDYILANRNSGLTDSTFGINIENNFHGTGLPNFAIMAKNTGYSSILSAQTPTSEFSLNTWNHILVSIDLANTANRSVYINDTIISMSFSNYTDSNIDFTLNNWSVASIMGGNSINGRLSNVFLSYDYMDLSIEANRRKFITTDSKPADGQAALNPIIYLPMDDPETCHINEGTGGNFVQNGTIARSNRGPNQYNAVAAAFDGSNDYLGKLLNTADTQQITINHTFKIASGENSGTMVSFSDSAVGTTVLSQTTGDNYRFQARNSNGTIIAQFNMTVYQEINYHLSLSIDLTDTAKRFVFLNGIQQPVTWSVYTDDTIDMSRDCVIGQQYNSTSGASFFKGDIGEVYVKKSYIDLSASNPFYDTETNKPKYLGENGELPTGSNPLIYLPVRADDAGNNLGTGGDFTVNSGPFVGARGGSEYWARSAKFDGSTGYLLNNSQLSGGADTKSLSMVFSINTDTLTGASRVLQANNNAASRSPMILDRSGSDIRFILQNSLGSQIYNANILTGISTGSWLTVHLSTDRALTNQNVYLNGSLQSVTPSVNIDDFIGFSASELSSIAEEYYGDFGGPQGSKWDGDIAFMYLTTDYIDFSQESNRLLFVDGLGFPVPLQPSIDDGLIPEGLIRMGFEDPNDLGYNSGTGGHFTVNGNITSGADVNV